MKILLLFCTSLILISNNLFSQTDFRNVRWGMTIQEVLTAETAPLSKREIDSDEPSLVYENVQVKGRKSRLEYGFTNGF